MDKPFVIYRSSAGSGKTYTLAKSFLKLALSGKNRYRRILGVTFTNKATEEMKQRIIKFLTLLKDGNEPALANDLTEELGIDHDLLKRRASTVLSEILHNYSRFSVVTIDSFFHQVIRSFAREMGLQGTFTIDLDTEKIMQEVIDQMLSEVGDEELYELKKWLTQFAEDKVEEGTSWDFRKDISKLAREVLKDEFKFFKEGISSISDSPQKLFQIKKELDLIQYSFEKDIKKISKEALDFIQDKGLELKSFSRGKNGPAGLFLKLYDLSFDISEGRREARDNLDAWITKTNKQRDYLESILAEFILPKYNELINFYDEYYVHYQSALEAKRYYYTFGILSYINFYLQRYRDENDVMLISDLPDFLNKIISDSDTPFIYEKVGARFDHYLIDEFQDTSAYQWNNFKPLVKNATDQGQFCMVVGDAKQSIYRFRGGDWKLLQHQVKKDIGDVMTVEQHLDTNWRSSGNIIAFNNDVFDRMKSLVLDSYLESPTEAAQLMMSEALTSFNEAFQKVPVQKNSISGLVKVSFLEETKDNDGTYVDLALEYTISLVEQLQEQGYALRDIAILTRTAREGKQVAQAFIDRANSPLAKPNMNYDVVSKEALYLTSSHVVQFIIALIKWLHNEKNEIELAHWYSTYHKYILNNHHIESEVYLNLADWASQVPVEFVNTRHQLKTLPLYELVEEICRLFNLSSIKEEYTYLQGFQDAVLDYTKNERGDIASFLVWWEDVRKSLSIIIADENNAVKILTIHKSKGLEFPVVILPFLHWSLDKQNPSIDSIMWCKSVAQKPFDQMPIIPLKYSKNLINTYWSDHYYEEKLKNLLDNLNILYVALTRPESALYIAAPSSKKKGLKKVNDLMQSLLENAEGWSEDSLSYTLGTLPPAPATDLSKAEVSLKDYSSHSWRGKLKLQMRDAAANNESQFDTAKAYGIKLHELLSRIKTKDDLASFEGHKLYTDLKSTVETLKTFFTDQWEVLTEVPILLPNNEQRRIDRMNRSKDEVVLIDYKTGKPDQKDDKQMQEYLNILSKINDLPLKGLLLYQETQQIVTIENGEL